MTTDGAGARERDGTQRRRRMTSRVFGCDKRRCECRSEGCFYKLPNDADYLASAVC